MTVDMDMEEIMANETQNMFESLIVTTVKEDHIFLPLKANSDLINFTDLKYKVIRAPRLEGSKKSVMAFSKGTILGYCKFKKRCSFEEWTNMVAEALRKSGVDCSIEGNDMIVSGKKVGATIYYENEEWLGLGLFVATTPPPKEIIKHITYPADYLARKNIKDSSSRMGYVSVDANVFEQALYKILKENGYDIKLITEKPTILNPERYVIYNGTKG